MKAKDIYAIHEALQACVDDYECMGIDESSIPELERRGGKDQQSINAYRKAKAAIALLPVFPVDENPVNNAVILTALREIEDTAKRCINLSEDVPDEMGEIRQRAQSALCFPPRNCDNAGTWLGLYKHFRTPKGMREMPPEWVDAIAAFCHWLVATPNAKGATDGK